MVDDRWIYRKLFVRPAGDEAADDIVVRHVGPVSDALLARGWIDRFFFLRYGEGGFHLRHRVRLTRTVDAATVRAALQVQGGVEGVVRIEEAAYVPETDKYGGPDGLDVC